MLYKRFAIAFGSGQTVPAVRISPASDPDGLADSLGLSSCQGTIAVVGGAAKFDVPNYQQQRRAAFEILRSVAALAARKKLVFVDGGTPYGVMRLLAQACSELGADSPPLVGVAPLGQVRWPGCLPGQCGGTDLDAANSAFVLVETDQWGAEADMLAAFAHQLVPGRLAVELLINGGKATRLDAGAFLRRGGNLVVLEGSGRFADELAAAVRAGRSDDPGIEALLSSKRIIVKPLSTPPADFATWLENHARW